MKKVLIFIIGLFTVFGSLAQETKTELKTRFDVIRNETVAGANTKTRMANAYQELADGTLSVYPLTTSGTDTYTATLVSLDAYTGRIIFVSFGNANTGASTLNITGSSGALGAVTIRKDVSGTWTALSSGDIVAGKLYRLYHDGTRFQIDLGGGGSGGGSWGSITGTLSSQTDLQTALDGKVNDTGSETIAGVKTFSSDPLIPDEVYGSGWNGSLEPPTKNAVYDKIETLGGGGITGTLTSTRIPYAASSSSLTDASELSWNNTTKALNIGTSTIQAPNDQIFIGESSGNTSNTQPYDIAIGFEAMQTANTGGTGVGRNIAIGHQALQTSNTDRQHQIAIGFRALGSNTGASENIGIGYRAGERWLGEDNIAIGFGAGYSLTGSGRDNVFIGYYAGGNNASPPIPYTNGAYSVFIGSNVGTDAPTARGQVNIANSFIVKGNAPGVSVPTYPDVGNAGIFVTSPTARLHLPAGTATANTAPLKITSGVLNTTPEPGAIENDGDSLYYTDDAGLRRTLAISTGASSNVWGSIGGTITDQTDLVSYVWKAGATTTLTGVATVTSNTANQHIFNGTWTASANNQYHANFTGTFTSRITASDNLFGYRFTPALVLAGSSAQNAYGLDVVPTFSGGTSPVYTSMRVVGPNTASTSRAFRVEDSANANLFTISSDGQISTKSGTIISTGGSTINFSTWGLGSASVAPIINLPTGITANPLFIIQRNGGGTFSSAINGAMHITMGLTSNNAGVDYVQIRNTPTWNLTGSYTGTISGYKYEPTNTSLTGVTAHNAFWATSGDVKLDNGNLILGTVGNKISIKEGSGGFMGQAALTAGTNAITVSGVTTSSRCFVQLVTPSGTTLTTEYQCVCTSNTVTIQANVAAGTINTADASTLNYIIFQPTP